MVPTSLALKELCLADGEFQIATRYWTGGIRIEIGASVTGVTLVNGVAVAKVPERSKDQYEWSKSKVRVQAERCLMSCSK